MFPPLFFWICTDISPKKRGYAQKIDNELRSAGNPEQMEQVGGKGRVRTSVSEAHACGGRHVWMSASGGTVRKRNCGFDRAVRSGSWTDGLLSRVGAPWLLGALDGRADEETHRCCSAEGRIVEGG